MAEASSRGRALLERDRDLERVRPVLRRAAAGEGGALVFEGPAGIGKTAMLRAARDAALEQGFRLLRARGAELERDFAFGVVRQLFEPVLASAAAAERAALLDGAAGLAASVFRFPRPGDGIDPLASIGADRGFAVLHGLYWLCANLAVERPLALVVDDAHWADDPSLRFLNFLLPRLEELPVVVLLASGPAEDDRDRRLLTALTVDPATEVVPLRPLTVAAVTALIADGLGSEPEAGFSAACREATGGLPFLLQTLVTALREQGISPVTASAPSVPEIATSTLGRWATLRLERLGPDAAGLARAVAILERADIDDAARLAGLRRGDAERAADVLVRAGVLDRAPLAFAHPILRASIYEEIPAADRADAHRHAARLLAETSGSPERVAEHLLAAAPAADAWVVERLQAAATAATVSGAPESAAAYLRRALAEPAPEGRRPSLQLALGLAEFSGRQPGWQRDLEGGIATAGDDGTRVAGVLPLALGLSYDLRITEALEALDGVARGLVDGDAHTRLVLQSTAVTLGLLDTATAPAVADRTRSLLLAAQDDDAPRPVLAVAASVAARANARAAEAAELAGRAVGAGARPLPEPGETTWLLHVVLALLLVERFDEAQALCDAAVSEARATANRLILAPTLALRSWLMLRRGDLTAAEADARPLLEEPVLSVLHRSLASGVLVATQIERGRLDDAARTLASVAVNPHGSTHATAWLRHARGRLRLAQRRFGEALADLLAAGEITTQTGAVSPSYLPWRSGAALAHIALGQPEEARRLSDEELRLAREFGAPRAIGTALRTAGLVAAEDAAEPLLREAAEVLDGSGLDLERARVLTDLGALLRRSNRRVEARELLRVAMDAAHRAGAALLADRAEAELRATGARPRRAMLTGLEALTASERRIAELAAQGLTNREIAQNLFVTARTVEGHLTNVFSKLGITARTEIPQALARTTTPTALT